MASTEHGAQLLSLLVLVLLPIQLLVASDDNPAKDHTVRWLIGSYSTCTAACGTGQRTRTVRCVRDEQWQGQTFEVSAQKRQCPSPHPPVTHKCNTHPCPGNWIKGKWSKCSVACGLGTQTREVHCEKFMSFLSSLRVSHSECGGRTPDPSRKCHTTDCHSVEDTIRSEDYTLIQLRRSKKLKLVVGGTVMLLPGQTVVVKCPVRRIDRDLVYWSKKNKMVSPIGRVKFTLKGNLRISRADPTRDPGVYTCMVGGDQQAKIVVQFIKKGDPITKIYKSWIKNNKKHLKHGWMSEKHRGNNRNNDVLLTYTKPEELRQQRDQIRNISEELSYLTGDWSACSATCTSKGHRKRKVSCSHVTIKYLKLVSDSECSTAGLLKPNTLEGCSAGSDCATWVPGPWTECRPRCGKTPGHKNRVLMCQWRRSGKNAWTACDSEHRPPTRKLCKPMPCLNGFKFQPQVKAQLYHIRSPWAPFEHASSKHSGTTVLARSHDEVQARNSREPDAVATRLSTRRPHQSSTPNTRGTIPERP